jgi:uncharacterized protein YkwD
MTVLGCLFVLLQDWETDFSSKDEAVRKEAYKKLEALTGEQRNDPLKLLIKVQTDRRQKFEAEYKRVWDHFMGYGTKGEKGMMAFFHDWMLARDQACQIIFDEKAYPVPPNRTAHGPMQGHDMVRPRLDQAMKLFDPIEKPAKEAASTAMNGSWAKALDGLKATALVVKEADEVLTRVRNPWEPCAIGSFDFLDAMAKIGEQKFADAIALYEKGGFTEAQKIMFFFIYGEIIENTNLNKIQSGMSGGEKQAVSKINEYRMAIGALPYEHDAKLTKAMKDHLNDISSGRTEYGHESKVPGKKTPSDRCRKAGWEGSVSENMAMMGAMQSVECWFWDGGHGRNNVNPFLDKIGLGDGGKISGFDNGSGEPCVLPRFSPPFSYGKWGTRKAGGGGPAPAKPAEKSKSPFSQKQ